TPAVPPYEQRRLLAPEQRLAPRQPRPDRGERMASHRNDARLVALAGDADRGVAQIHAVEMQPRELGQAQAGRVEQLEHGLVAQGERRVLSDLHQVRRLVRREGLRELPGGLRSAYAERRVERIAVIARQVLEEAAPGGEHARERAPVQPAAMKL